MKILHVLHGLPPESDGGTEQYVLRLAKEQAALRRRGNQVTVVAGLGSEISTIPNRDGFFIRRYPTPINRRKNVQIIHDDATSAWFRAALKEFQTDVVHVHHWIYLTDTLVRDAREAGARVVVTIHDLWSVCGRLYRVLADGTRCKSHPVNCLQCLPEGGDQAARFREFQQELGAANYIISPSRRVGMFFLQAEMVIPQSLRIVPHPALNNLPERKKDSRDPLVRIGYFGNLTLHKGPHILIDAFALIARNSNIKCDVLVAGRTDDIAYETALRAHCAGLPVVFAGLYVPEELPEFGIDIAVFPTLSMETHGFALDEALSMRCIPLVPRGTTLADRLDIPELTFPPGDSFALAERLMTLLTDPAYRADIRRRLPENKQTWQGHLLELEALYAAPVASTNAT